MIFNEIGVHYSKSGLDVYHDNDQVNFENGIIPVS
jgi:hypothetical protein